MTDQPDSREVEVTQQDRNLADGLAKVIVAGFNGFLMDHEVEGIRSVITAALAQVRATTADRVAVLEAALRAIVERTEEDYDFMGTDIRDLATTALATVDLPRLDLAKD